MNTISVSTRVRKAISVAFTAVVLLISNPLTSQANGGHKKISGLTDEQVSVQYVGTNENHVIFHVTFENPGSQKFWLIIKNDAGDVVYRKQYSDAHFSKSIFFQKEETADINPTFVIRNNDHEVVRQFAVNRTITENTVVTRL